MRIRRATRRDLDALVALESLCFQPFRRASRRSLARSLRSPRQSVWVVDASAPTPGAGSPSAPAPRNAPNPLAALLVLWHHPHRVRVYDVATHPDLRGHGLGNALMRHAEELARKAGCALVSLEADPREPGLVPWYERQGYRVVVRLADFYAKGRPAVRMVREP